MANLKFSECKWTDDGLMYVEFKLGKELLKWFPHWGDLAYLVHCSQYTEEKNGGRWRTFFEIIGYEALISSLIERIGDISAESEGKILESLTELRQTFFSNLDENASASR